uniref:TIL domain-containing protein n=1 Tax=Cuerna arida TaxID=1464854 RepID=A0A1B6FZ59_9HEMI
MACNKFLFIFLLTILFAIAECYYKKSDPYNTCKYVENGCSYSCPRGKVFNEKQQCCVAPRKSYRSAPSCKNDYDYDTCNRPSNRNNGKYQKKKSSCDDDYDYDSSNRKSYKNNGKYQKPKKSNNKNYKNSKYDSDYHW